MTFAGPDGSDEDDPLDAFMAGNVRDMIQPEARKADKGMQCVDRHIDLNDF
jgi:hypothetical protein